eukprot:7641226-Pyramimonas_sp.AAC.2
MLGECSRYSAGREASGGQSSQLPSAGPRALLTTLAGLPFFFCWEGRCIQSPYIQTEATLT